MSARSRPTFRLTPSTLPLQPVRPALCAGRSTPAIGPSWLDTGCSIAWRFAIHLLLIAAFTAPAPAQEPHIGYIFPAGARQGTSEDVIVGGQFLGGATNLIVTGGGIRAHVVGYFKELTRQEINGLRNRMDKLTQTVGAMEGDEKASAEKKLDEMKRTFMEQGFDEKGRKPKARPDPKKQPNMQIREQVTLRIAIKPNATPGVREVRLLTAKGLSNPMVFHIGSLPELTEVEPNDREPTEAPPLRLPAVMNGQIMPGDVDLFAIPATTGQRLVFRTAARSLIPYLADAVPGWFQATLALYGPDGHEVAYVDDNQFDPDPVLTFDVPADGTYRLEIKDAIYRGREDFVYRIAMGEASDVPPSPAAPRPDALADMSEIEHNNDLASAQAIILPAAIEGCIDRPGDCDIFRFKGRAGETIVAEVFARRQGSPLDSLLTLTDAKGACLKVEDDYMDRGVGLVTHQADSRLTFTLATNDVYAIHLGDVQQHGGADYRYRLRIGPQQPDFDLRVTPATVNIPKGGTVPVTVHALRQDGFEGDIVLSLVNPPRGFHLSGNILPAGQDQIRVTLTAPWRPEKTELTMAMEGKAVIGGQSVIHTATPAEDMMQAFLWRHLVSCREWAIAISPRPRPAVEADLPEDGILRIPAGGSMSMTLHTAGRRRMGTKPRFELDEPPDGLAIGTTVVKQEEGEATVTVTADAEKLKPGFRGNLIVNAMAPTAKRNLVLYTSPAVPFEIVNQ